MPEAPLTRRSFVDRLLERVPEVEPCVRENADEGGVLLHLLMADLLRLAVKLFDAGELDLERRLLDEIDAARRSGDADVVNAVEVSFIEHVGAYPEETPEFVASLPPGLRDGLGPHPS